MDFSQGGQVMKMKKDVKIKCVEKKKLTGKKGMPTRSQVKAGNFWDDMRSLYGITPRS
jgi:hypothetical protein